MWCGSPPCENGWLMTTSARHWACHAEASRRIRSCPPSASYRVTSTPTSLCARLESGGRDHFEHRGTVCLALLLADPGDAVEGGEGRGALRGQSAQRGISEHDVGRHPLLFRNLGAPLAQRLEHRSIGRLERLGCCRLAPARGPTARTASPEHITPQ